MTDPTPDDLPETFLMRRGEPAAAPSPAAPRPIDPESVADDLATLPHGAQPEQREAARQRCPVQISGYEILGEVGRGGMGVVYKATHQALKRTVALKMIRDCGYADEADIARFRAEGEAVARLAHPNIVQIHEVGENGGLPYFALEFVGGGSLAQKLAAGKLAPREAARLVETLAGAVQLAHSRNIVHRDLKPANVLMTTDGTPKIVDFGLAKTLDVDGGQTQVGEMMGTPQYMAPEQAGGRARDAGPPADIYALGVILYECLAGRPPFQGDSVLDTLEQVRTREPASLRQLQPNTPRDLETICLKCLRKEPERRYASAAALAEDLRRWRQGEPITARAVGSMERAVKWVRRHAVASALAAAALLAMLLGAATSLALAGWAFHERDQATNRLTAAQTADRRRVQVQVEQLGSAVPEAVPAILAALKEDREAVQPRLRELWADEGGDRRRRMRAGLALVDDDPALREPLADWMIETDDPREMLLVREVLAPQGAGQAERLWNQADDPHVKIDVRFRALAALAAFDPANPRWSQAAPTAVEQLLKADPLFLGLWIQALRPVRDPLNDRLTKVFRGEDKPLTDRRLQAATALANYAADRPTVLADLACEADAQQFAVLRPMLEKNGKEAQAALTAELSHQAPAQENEADRIARAKRQANAAAALVMLGAPDAAWPLLKHSRTPDTRTVLLHGLATRGADHRVLIHRLEEEKDASIRAALILALGEYTDDQLPTEARAALTPKLLAWYRDDADPGVHGAIDWLLRNGKEGPVDRPLDWGGSANLEKIDAELAGKPGPAGQRWYVNGQGQTLTAVRGPVEFLMGSPEDEPGHAEGETLHSCAIGRSFAVADRPVTVAQWEKFLKAMEDANLMVKHFYWKDYAPEPNCPIVTVSWYDAAMYCRWLSEQENVPEKQMVYPSIPEILKCADGRTPLKLPQDYLSRTGYRLPTGAEFEYACRADTATRWYFGGAEEFLPRYAWFITNSQNRSWPVGQKKPNELGLFDVHGNAWTWCQESFQPYDIAGTEDREDDADIKDSINRVLRGGSFRYQAAILRAAFREFDRPSYPGESEGMRLARTLPRDHFAVLPPK